MSWVTRWSRWIYGRFHHEPFDPQRADWEFPLSGPLSGANGALPWIIFQRDREQFEREWAPELHVRLERASTADAKIVITNLARASVLLQLVQLRTMTHAMPFERQYLNDPLVGGNTWTQHIGERILAITGKDYEGTIAASVSFYAAGRLYKSDWFRFDVEIQRGRFEKVEPVTLPARRVRVLATRQADKFRRQMVKDVVHETASSKKADGDFE